MDQITLDFTNNFSFCEQIPKEVYIEIATEGTRLDEDAVLKTVGV